MWDLQGLAIAAGLLVPVLIIVGWCVRLARRPKRQGPKPRQQDPKRPSPTRQGPARQGSKRRSPKRKVRRKAPAPVKETEQTTRLMPVATLPHPPLPTRDRYAAPPMPRPAHALRPSAPARTGFAGPDPDVLRRVVDGLQSRDA